MRKSLLSSLKEHRWLTLLVKESDSIWGKIVKNSSIGVGGSVVTIFIGLGRTAILTKSILIADYGKVLIVVNIFMFLGGFFGLRVHDVIYRFYPQFEQEKNVGAIRGILVICFLISMVVGILLGLGVYAMAPWIAERFYQAPCLVNSFRIYAIAVLVSSLGGISVPVLRLHDHFATIAASQILAGGFTLTAFAIYFYNVGNYQLEHIVAIFGLGIIIQTAFPLIQVARVVSPYMRAANGSNCLRSLGQYRRKIVSTLFQTNLVGYLKLISTPGDVFLLGILSTPVQVALYGLAQQLVGIFHVFSNNIQNAITPEVMALAARRQLFLLRSFIRNYMMLTLIAGGIFAVVLFFMASPLLVWISKPQYLKAVPVFNILIIVACIGLSLVIFYPLGLSMDLIRWHNYAQIVNIVILAVIIAVLDLNANKMAWIQLAGIIVYIFIFVIPVWNRLGSFAGKKESDAPTPIN